MKCFSGRLEAANVRVGMRERLWTTGGKLQPLGAHIIFVFVSNCNKNRTCLMYHITVDSTKSIISSVWVFDPEHHISMDPQMHYVVVLVGLGKLNFSQTNTSCLHVFEKSSFSQTNTINRLFLTLCKCTDTLLSKETKYKSDVSSS